LKELGHKLHIGWQLDLLRAQTAAVMVRPDASLIHPGDERGTRRRADRSRYKGALKQHAIRRKLVHVGCLNRLLAIASKMRRHVLGDELEDVWFFRWRIGGVQRG
jgi:hypothetical protein